MMKYYLAIKSNELLIHTTWMGLKNIMLSEKASLKGYILQNSIKITFLK